MFNCKTFITAFFLFSIFSGHAFAKFPLTYLDQMVYESDSIIVGRVVRIEDTGERYDWIDDVKQIVLIRDIYVYHAFINLEHVIKGGVSNEEKLVVEYSPNLGDLHPRFTVEEQCLLFLKRHKGLYTVVGGFPGKIKIKNGVAGPVHMVGLDGYHDLGELLQMISTYLD